MKISSNFLRIQPLKRGQKKYPHISRKFQATSITSTEESPSGSTRKYPQIHANSSHYVAVLLKNMLRIRATTMPLEAAICNIWTAKSRTTTTTNHRFLRKFNHYIAALQNICIFPAKLQTKSASCSPEECPQISRQNLLPLQCGNSHIVVILQRGSKIIVGQGKSSRFTVS